MKNCKYQKVYNYLVNSDYRISTNLKVIINTNYREYLQTKKKAIDDIINAIVSNDLKKYNQYISNYDNKYKVFSNHQIHNNNSFKLLRDKIVNYEQKR